MQKSTRLAACEPCRRRKQSCDHARPVCTRCVDRGRQSDCDYRDRPFRKRQRVSDVQSAQEGSASSQPLASNTHSRPDREHQYPDPGYQGSSSHVAIFDRVSEQRRMGDRAVDEFDIQRDPIPYAPDDTKISKGAHILSSIISQFNIKALRRLVSFWLGTGTNLVLAGRLTEACVKSVTDELASLTDDPASHTLLARRLSENSAKSHVFSRAATFADYSEEVCQTHIRWESLVISFVALGRASIDVPYYPPLYSLQAELEVFQKLVTGFADDCLELTLSTGRMGDLLLVCQYENWILHSVIDGDQSFESWRRLGDVISSVLYLGYHQPSKPKPNTPSFLTELRETCFTRIYSDDKNVAVFLGRPPRLSSTFCCFRLPRPPSLHDRDDTTSSDHISSVLEAQNMVFFGADETITFNTSIVWAALCARLKEKALEVVHATDAGEAKKQRAAVVNTELTQLWSELPQHMKLEGSLRTHRHRGSFEQDFLLFARLDWLQVRFLLESGELLHRSTYTSQNHECLMAVSGEMLSLVVEAIVSRDHLVNSGTGLVWKVAHYGLPAAGVISLSLLQPLSSSSLGATPIHKMVQNLAAFVVEIQGEGLVRITGPDYALLNQAARTIDRLLETLLCGSLQRSATDNTSSGAAHISTNNNLDESAAWSLSATGDSLGYEFDFDFWRMLGEHPSLTASDGVAMEPMWLDSEDLGGVNTF